MRPFDQLILSELARASFDFERPRPLVAWEAFKSFVVRPIPGQKTISIGFSCYHSSDRDQTLWLEFARQLEDEASRIGQNCGCGFSRPVPADLNGINKSSWWWAEHGTIEQWFRDVESTPAFNLCIALDGWRWEVYSL